MTIQRPPRPAAPGLLLLLAALLWAAAGRAAEPVLIGIDAEFGLPSSTSAQAVALGVRIAVEEINSAGGVLGGRPLAVVERDNRSVPARSVMNLRELAAMPDLVAVFCGKFSPVVIESLPELHALKLPLLDPWAAADAITDHGHRPSYTFRLSLRDSWAIPAMLEAAAKKGATRVGLLLPNTAWGRSSLKAAQRPAAVGAGPELAGVAWYNWGDTSLLGHYRQLREAGAGAILLVANEREGAILVREVAALPPAERLPLLAHWGVTGGQLHENARAALAQLDFSVVQTFSFLADDSPRARRVLAAAQRLGGAGDPRRLGAPVGVAHAYDLTHILARAINLAGTTERAAIRDALEQVRDYPGLLRHYQRPFAPERHEALGPEQLFMARYADDGAIVPIAGGR